ncbi:GNAT family N-acetyltransferase [Vibrio hannami]|uniref:GNAT family N-acetyltransferase n=1 Tax=Vibrio hannami TaxID=2717094 RepID=UPI00240ED0EA|nr:GNAT family N-acetyltransferase [Vibrio hannami]MDG3087748.1 GNAT family N-acetyltransferase [Vibrio hannami]
MKFSSVRLRMAQISENDRSLYLELHTNPNVIDLCFDRPSLKDIELKFQSRLPAWRVDSENWLCLVITEAETGRKVGVTGFKLENGIAEVGYLLLPEFFGRGYGTESLAALIGWASKSLGITNYEAIVTKGNVGSEKVLTKCGFTLSKIVPNAYCIKGLLYDDHIYSLSIRPR